MVATGLLLGALAAGTSATPQDNASGPTGSQAERRQGSAPGDAAESQLSPAQQNLAPAPTLSSSGRSEPASLRDLPVNLLLDQKAIWLSPLHTDRHHWPWLAAGAGVSAVLFATDSSVGQHLTSSLPGTGYDAANAIGKWSGALTDLAAAGSFLAIGQWRGDQRARDTGVLGVRAVLDSMVVAGALKLVTQRPRPADSDGLPNHNSDGEFFTEGRSFPSGHAAAGWALAAVVAKQYRHRRWAPPLAYGLAATVAVSRVPARKHFPSDVFVGSVMGYLIGRHVWRSYDRSTRTVAERRWQLMPQVPAGGGAAFTLDIAFRLN